MFKGVKHLSHIAFCQLYAEVFHSASEFPIKIKIKIPN